MTQGALYIVTHKKEYIDLLLKSAASLKRVMPELPITVISQFPIQSDLFERVIPLEASDDGFYDKIKWMQASPYERTLFLDVDTYIVAPVPELFTLLDHFDIAATHEEYLNTDWFNDYPLPAVPASFPEFNTGVLVFKQSDAIQSFFAECTALYAAFHQAKPNLQIGDQPFFREALYESALRVATLTREYNCKFRGQGYLNGAVKILHGHHEFTLDEKYIQQVILTLNASKKPRVYIAGRVYEQKITGRLVGHRTAHRVGTFPEPPESITRLRLQALNKRVRAPKSK